MTSQHPVTIYRHDYQPSAWCIDNIRLSFYLHRSATRVVSELRMRCVEAAVPALRLDGVNLQLKGVSVDAIQLTPEQYSQDKSSLTLFDLQAQCVVSIETVINPDANTALEGLYRSSGNFCTQCEAEGFRKITYCLDRPDVLSVYDVIIEADQGEYPVLLSNGNQVAQMDLDGGRHRVHWHDPHPKPCYLFALVAGSLCVVEDQFTSASGRDVLLQIYVQEHNLDYCDYAMRALKNAMHWDEHVYGFEYDLERFMIVAVDDFNMGAMENKGLNIFNSRFVLADRKTSTDTDFMGVEAVIAHEYFHNWTGNRITCRDWFQLSLKEGLTVFRDQCFSSDMHSATVKRIEDVRLLRARQFAEDASPMAHPIRPDSYIEINNFYTLTVYEKGAEVIRMLYTLLGPELWHKGMDEYVRRHDGTATTCDAFIDAMQSVTEKDLTQFRLWYSIAGTPILDITEQYDAAHRRYTLTVNQSIVRTPDQEHKPALHIPLCIDLLDVNGHSLIPASQKQLINDSQSVLLDVKQATQHFCFDNISSPPIASLLRGFSAPVKLQQQLDDEQLALIAAHDTDGFNRWEALQRLSERIIMARLNDKPDTGSMAALNHALGQLLADNDLASAFKAETLQLPSIDTLAESLSVVDYQALGEARDAVARLIATEHENTLQDLVCHGRDHAYDFLDEKSIGMRKLANMALSILSHRLDHDWPLLARKQFTDSDNMTDQLRALVCLCHTDTDARLLSLQEFHTSADGNKLVMDKWFAAQATARRSQVIDDVDALYRHVDFDLTNPNRVRALLASFALNNPVAFHASDGRGYAFVAERVLELDAINPQVSARLVSPLTRWARLGERQKALMLAQLQRIIVCDSLSPDVYELVSKSLKSAS